MTKNLLPIGARFYPSVTIVSAVGGCTRCGCGSILSLVHVGRILTHKLLLLLLL